MVVVVDILVRALVAIGTIAIVLVLNAVILVIVSIVFVKVVTVVRSTHAVLFVGLFVVCGVADIIVTVRDLRFSFCIWSTGQFHPFQLSLLDMVDQSANVVWYSCMLVKVHD